MTSNMRHISVCVCTYKRPEFLKRLLAALINQDAGGLFTYSIVIADNDHLRSAEKLVREFAVMSPISVTYCVEPRQNIAMARNKAIESATGDFIALIDDDELPIRRWLLTLFNTCTQFDVDGVLGPVKPYFDTEPPNWIVRGKLFERRSYRTGSAVEWYSARTGNVLLKKSVFGRGEEAFRPMFRAGEDQDFFRRMIEKGYLFIWCEDAAVYEVVPPVRWRRAFMLKRALLRGASARLDPLGARGIAKSVIALPAYMIALPFAALLGQHRFMILLIKICDHAGKVLALMGINPVKDAYVTD